jgi:hypothetical protein
MPRRDIYEHGAHGRYRMNLALNRSKQAAFSDENEKASNAIKTGNAFSRTH